MPNRDGDGSCSCICGQCSDRYSRQLLTACHIFAPFPLICRTHLVAAAGGTTRRAAAGVPPPLPASAQGVATDVASLQALCCKLQALTCVRLLPPENICASFELFLLLLVLFSVLHFDLLPRQSFSIFVAALKRKMQQQKCCRRMRKGKEME